MKALRLVGLSILIWGLSWLWPEVNQVLTLPVMIVLTIGLGVATLIYALVRHLDTHHDSNGAGQDHPSRPIPMALTR